MAYQSSTGRTLLWGGLAVGTGSGRDTWEWDGDGWIQVADTGPESMIYAGLAFDSVRNVAVLFTQNTAGTVWETWEWDGAWTQIEDTGPQTNQAAFQLVYDAAREVTLLEGGAVAGAMGGYTPVGTWQWDGTSWTQVADTGAPARLLGGLAYDANRERVVLFGGANLDYTYETDTWEWDGNDWEQVTNIGPPARLAHGMTGTSGDTLLFGGVSDASPTDTNQFRDTWTWDGTHWHQRQDMGPSPRWVMPLVWDSARERGVIFGGGHVPPGQPNYILLGDTWESFETP